jgi:hypothetical protein
MPLKLTDEQRQALAVQPDVPVQVIDEHTNTAYVLVRADLYERLTAASEEDSDLRDTYPAQMESALRAGWADPMMDDYNNYDENRQKLCP